MKTDNIKVLLDNGLQLKTISKLTESQIRVLAEKFKKEETKEEVKQTVTNAIYDPNNPTDQKTLSQKGIHIDPNTKKISMTLGPTGEVKEDNTINIVQDPDATADGMPTTEGEMNEKFESKAQQKFFWARCNKSKDKSSKWCKWAEEFSDKTKNFKKLPEKLHPEKTVNIRKESYDQFLEDSIVEMVEKYINPSMTKSQLIKSINEKVNKSESFMLKTPKKNSMFSKDEGKEMKTMKRPIGKLSSIGENTKTVPSRPDTDTDKKEKGKDRDKKTPYGPKHNPKPKAFKGEYKENEIAPSRPDTDTDKKEKGKDRDKKTPYGPKHNPKPKAFKEKLPSFLTWNKLGVNLK